MSLSDYNKTRAVVIKYFSNPFYFDAKEYSANYLAGQFFYTNSFGLTVCNGDYESIKELVNKAKIEYYLKNFAGKSVSLVRNDRIHLYPKIVVDKQGIASDTFASDDKGLYITLGNDKVYLADVKFDQKFLTDQFDQVLVLSDDVEALIISADKKRNQTISEDKAVEEAKEKKRLDRIRKGNFIYMDLVDIEKVYPISKKSDEGGDRAIWIVKTPTGDVWVHTVYGRVDYVIY